MALQRKSVPLGLNVWYDEGDGHIHLASRDGKGLISTVNNDPSDMPTGPKGNRVGVMVKK